MGPSVKYVMLFFVNFDLPLSHFVTHPRTRPKSMSHISDPPIFSRPSTKNPDKSPLYKFSQLFGRAFVRGSFVRGGFCPYLLLSEYICYNRKLKITLTFICMIKKFISVTSHALDPSPVTNCHTFSDPLPLSVTYFMDGPLREHLTISS